MDVEKLAKIARLELTEEEKELFSRQLDEVLKAFEVLDEVEGDEISLHPFEIKNEFRDDEEKRWEGKLMEKGLQRGPKVV